MLCLCLRSSSVDYMTLEATHVPVAYRMAREYFKTSSAPLWPLLETKPSIRRGRLGRDQSWGKSLVVKVTMAFLPPSTSVHHSLPHFLPNCFSSLGCHHISDSPLSLCSLFCYEEWETVEQQVAVNCHPKQEFPKIPKCISSQIHSFNRHVNSLLKTFLLPWLKVSCPNLHKLSKIQWKDHWQTIFSVQINPLHVAVVCPPVRIRAHPAAGGSCFSQPWIPRPLPSED